MRHFGHAADLLLLVSREALCAVGFLRRLLGYVVSIRSMKNYEDSEKSLKKCHELVRLLPHSYLLIVLRDSDTGNVNCKAVI